MFLSPEQQYLLAKLRIFRCLRMEQAAQMLYRAFGTKPQHVPHIVRQLRVRGQLRERGGVLTEVGASARDEMLDAVEVLLAIFGGVLPETAANASPFLLCAYSSAEDLQLQILHVPEGQEQSRCVLADALPEPAVPTMLVLLLRHAAQREQIRTVRPCVLAFRNDSGTLVFEQNESCMKMEDNYDDKQQKL